MKVTRGRASIRQVEGTHRLSLQLEDEQLELVTEIARLRGSSVAAVIRDAIELMYGDNSELAVAATRRLLADEVLAGRATTLRW
jgi:hypothetical protein